MTTQRVKTHMDANVQQDVFVSAPQWAAEYLLVEALITVLSPLPSLRNCYHSSHFSHPFPWNPPLPPTLFSHSTPPTQSCYFSNLPSSVFISIKIVKLSTHVLNDVLKATTTTKAEHLFIVMFWPPHSCLRVTEILYCNLTIIDCLTSAVSRKNLSITSYVCLFSNLRYSLNDLSAFFIVRFASCLGKK